MIGTTLTERAIKQNVGTILPCDYEMRYADSYDLKRLPRDLTVFYSSVKPKRCNAQCTLCLDCPKQDCDYKGWE